MRNSKKGKHRPSVESIQRQIKQGFFWPTHTKNSKGDYTPTVETIQRQVERGFFWPD